VERGMPVWYLVPDGVVQYIEKRGLYRDQPRRRGGPGSPPGRQQASGDHASYDRAPGSAAPAGSSDDPAQPPLPHLREVPR
jgi:nicotinate-nucleotide adenylyltransferase